MTLTRNARNNLDALLSIVLDTNYMNIHIDSVDMVDDTFMCNFTRKVSINHLQKVNEYFNVDIREKVLHYSLIVNKNTNTIKLHIEGIENYQMDLLGDSEALNSKVQNYNEKITDRLIRLSEYLYETIYPTDDEVRNWTFYFIPYHKRYIAFANADLQCQSAIKISVSDFSWFKNEAYPSFYKSVDLYKGTLNDAKIISMRRNHNSKHGSNWRPCLHGTPIEELWIV